MPVLCSQNAPGSGPEIPCLDLPLRVPEGNQPGWILPMEKALQRMLEFGHAKGYTEPGEWSEFSTG